MKRMATDSMTFSNEPRSRSVYSCGHRHPRLPQDARFRPGFSLVELLVVIGIIVILVGILMPTISSIRKAGNRTKSASIISNLGSAIQRYYQEFNAYPGPLRNSEVGITSAGVAIPNSIFGFGPGITMSENLVLGLSGGLGVDASNRVVFDVNAVGTGSRCLNLAAGKINRQYTPYIEGVPLSTGNFADDAGQARDTNIPEYLDGYGDALPVLYLRANLGARTNTVIGSQNDGDNSICTNGTNAGQYDLTQVWPYVSPDVSGNYIGVGKDSSKKDKYVNSAAFPAHGLQTSNPNATIVPNQAGSAYPYDAYAMLGNPAYANGTRFTEPRQRDGFILIGAGPDRIYGTEDDICSFGSIE